MAGGGGGGLFVFTLNIGSRLELLIIFTYSKFLKAKRKKRI